MSILQKLWHINKYVPAKFVKSNLFSLKNNNTLKSCVITKRLIHNEQDDYDENPNKIDIDAGYTEILTQFINPSISGHKTLVIQPYIKWGKNKKTITSPDLQLNEAVALVKTLPKWTVTDSMCISMMTLKKDYIFGKGNLDMLTKKIRSNSKITAVFISMNLLRPIQIKDLQELFGVPVYDRYSIVIQIFRVHAKTTEAKLQVALAELPYIWTKLNWTAEDSGGRINLSESRRMILHSRESKLKNSLKKLKEHRKLIRQHRKNLDIPSVAVVGYTNAGKTCLIKALTGDASLTPENKLFATLDTTAHEGILPCKLKILYVDTIGFIQDIPEGLIEPFVATFEDAILSDVIVHVYDASHPDKHAQVIHVKETLTKIMSELLDEEKPVIEVANKCDLIPAGTVSEDILTVSSTQSHGIDLLRNEIQKKLLSVTGRQSVTIRVKSGSSIASWLYKETTVVNAEPDEKDLQYILMSVIATEHQMHKFRKFLKNNK
ncbi:hypothetical protein HCN44_008357 [Aphidius gifuensis]|uniref:Hflx-type G domain-containing protein n=1 Tax=Aphidius gifuensis TaxID=684658 RepID=A0A834XLZ6_APHGI|nr:putative GTP-binding protein 6 [Aphidius gifuensis]KAF7989683.1 hypothetical protein HCN44_008357 [Aphidius gifuensis]